MKKPRFPMLEGDGDVSGHVKRDDRGNAIWEWKDEDTLNQRLYHPGLSVADDQPLPNAPVMVNKLAAKAGYDPYHSGMIDKDGASRPRKRDLRALSQWIALKKGRGEDPAD